MTLWQFIAENPWNEAKSELAGGVLAVILFVVRVFTNDPFLLRFVVRISDDNHASNYYVYCAALRILKVYE